MFTALKNHPFAVEAFFEKSFVLTYAVPKEHLQTLIPECLQLDTLNDEWAFIAVAMVQTTGLRPKGFPAFLGNDFFLIGYRVFVRYSNNAGKKLRGLYILRSETDKTKMKILGNIFTHYNYIKTDIAQTETDKKTTIQSKKSNFKIEIDNTVMAVPLPLNSPFKDWKEARRFSGPLPFTFTYDAETRKILIIEGVRENWLPGPIYITNHRFAFFDTLGIKNPVLANAFIIKNIPYLWKKGKTEIWNK